MWQEIAAIASMFTAVMVGVIRETLTSKTPIFFNKEIHATVCLAGVGIGLF